MDDNTLRINLRAIDHASPVMKTFESTVIRTVGAVSAALAAITTIGFPIAAAAEFQKNMLNVKKTTDLSYESTTQLGKALVELSTTTNKTADDLAKIAEMGGRMGVSDKEGIAGLLEFTKQVSILSTALDVSAEEVATSMGKLANIFSLSMDQYQKAGAVINQLDNQSTATATELFDVMRRIGNLGSTVRFDQAAALSAVAIDLGFTAETAGTSLIKIFANMKTKAADFAAFMGTSTKQWVGVVEKDGVEALRQFLARLNSMPAEIAAAQTTELTGGGRIFSLVNKLREQQKLGSGSLLELRLADAAKEAALGTSALKEQQSVLTGLIAQWQVFKNKLTSVALAGGSTVLHSLTVTLIKLGDYLSDPATIAQFTDLMKSLSDGISATADVLKSFGQNSNLSWSKIFRLAELYALITLVERVRKGILSLVASAGLSKISAPLDIVRREEKKAQVVAATTGTPVVTTPRRLVVAQQLELQALERAHQAALSAITGQGITARIAQLQREQEAQRAAVIARQKSEVAQVQRVSSRSGVAGASSGLAIERTTTSLLLAPLAAYVQHKKNLAAASAKVTEASLAEAQATRALASANGAVASARGAIASASRRVTAASTAVDNVSGAPTAAQNAAIQQQAAAHQAAMTAITGNGAKARRAILLEEQAAERALLLSRQRQERVAAPAISAQNYYTTRVAAQQAAVRALETAHQTALSQISGTGAVARRTALNAQHQADLAALATTQARQLAQYQRHYERLMSTALVGLSQLSAAEAAHAKRQEGLSRAGSTLSDNLSLVPGSQDAQRAARAALAAAEAEVARSTLRGKFMNLFSFAEGGGLQRIRTSLTAPFAGYATATTVASRASVVFAGSLELVGRAALGTARALTTIVSTLSRLLGFVAMAYMFYEIGKSILEATGVMGKFVSATNSVITAVNKLTGLKIPTISTGKEDNSKVLSIIARTKATEESTLAADKFNRIYGAVDYTAGSADVSKQLSARTDKLKTDIDLINKGVKLDIMKGGDPLAFLGRGSELVVQMNKKILNTGLLLEREQSLNAVLQKQMVGKGLAAEKVRDRLYHARAELEKMKTGADLPGFGAPATTSIEKRVALEKEIADLTKQQAAQQEALTSATATHAAGLVRELNIIHDQNSVIEAQKEAILATAGALNSTAWREFFAEGVDEAGALVTRLRESEKEVNSISQELTKATAEMAQTQATINPDASKVQAASAAYGELSVSLQKAKEKQEALMEEARKTATVQASPAGKGTQDELIRYITNLGTAAQVTKVLRDESNKTKQPIASMFKGLSNLSKEAITSNYGPALGQLIFAKEANSKYQQLAEAAKAAAESASKAVTRVMANARNEIEALTQESIKSLDTLRQNVANARLVQQDRKTDQRTAQKLAELDVEEAKQQAILDILRQQSQISPERFSVRSLDIKQDFERQRFRVTDSASDEKAKNSAKEKVKIFEELSVKVDDTGAKLTELAAKLRDDTTIPAEKRAEMLDGMRVLTAEMEGYLRSILAVKNGIEGLQTSTGAPAVPPAVLEGMQKKLVDATNSKNIANLKAAEVEKAVTAEAQHNMEAAAESAQAAVDRISTAIDIMAKKSGVGVAQVAADLATLAASEEFKNIRTKFEGLASAGSIKVGTVGFNADAFLAELDEAGKVAANKNIKVPVAADTTELSNALTSVQAEWIKTLTALRKDPLADGGKPVVVNAGLKIDEVAERIAIPKAIGTVTVDAKLRVNGSAGGEALIGGDADGGPIIGAGDSRSDSILRRLSHGEYVSDAGTTRAFGFDFFRGLKSIAKTGNPSSLVRWMMPRIPKSQSAPVQLGSGAYGLAGVEPGNVMNLDITFQRQQVGRVSGSRDTINNLVSALNMISKGA